MVVWPDLDAHTVDCRLCVCATERQVLSVRAARK
jgi:hypothetical protein